jgi:hypothetical protein
MVLAARAVKVEEVDHYVGRLLCPETVTYAGTRFEVGEFQCHPLYPLSCPS